MGPLVRLKDAMANIVGTGRSKVADVQQDRERSRLMRELGEARYADSKGVETSAAEMDRIIGLIDALDQPADVTDADRS